MKQRWEASEDPLDCRGVDHGNGPEWEEDRLFICRPECLQVYLNFLFTFFCVELNHQVMVTFFGRRQSWGSQNPNCCSTCNVLGNREGMRCWVQKRRYAVSIQPRWETKVVAHATTTTTTITQTTTPTITSHYSRYCGLCGSGFGSKFFRKLPN